MAGQTPWQPMPPLPGCFDACVLSLGLLGVTVFGAGLVLSCIPGAATFGGSVCDAGRKVLDARRDFARSASEGLERLEKVLPAVVVANSAACVAENARAQGLPYVGCAIPFPVESQSDFSSLAAEISSDEMDKDAEELRELSQQADAAKSLADAARLRGWTADCGGTPYCLEERATTLAGLAGEGNPHYPSEEGWGFGVPLLRARAYYAARAVQEKPLDSRVEELTNSAARSAFYDYALEQVRDGTYAEHEDGTVQINLPELPHNVEETKASSLYTDDLWPCTGRRRGRCFTRHPRVRAQLAPRRDARPSVTSMLGRSRGAKHAAWTLLPWVRSPLRRPRRITASSTTGARSWRRLRSTRPRATSRRMPRRTCATRQRMRAALSNAPWTSSRSCDLASARQELGAASPWSPGRRRRPFPPSSPPRFSPRESFLRGLRYRRRPWRQTSRQPRTTCSPASLTESRPRERALCWEAPSTASASSGGACSWGMAQGTIRLLPRWGTFSTGLTTCLVGRWARGCAARSRRRSPPVALNPWT